MNAIYLCSCTCVSFLKQISASKLEFSVCTQLLRFKLELFAKTEMMVYRR